MKQEQETSFKLSVDRLLSRKAKRLAYTMPLVAQVTHARQVNAQIARASTLSEIELHGMAKEIGAPIDLLRETARLKKLPVVMFSAGGIASPSDAALMMKHGMDGVFVYVARLWAKCKCDLTCFSMLCSGSGIFKSANPEALARAIVVATTHFNDPVKIAEVSTGLGEGMRGESQLGPQYGKEMTADRGY